MKTMLAAAVLLISLYACSPDAGKEAYVPPADRPNDNNPQRPDANKMKITAGGASFVVTFVKSASATAFKALLPMTVEMDDMNGNEKYYYLPESLPTSASNEGNVQNGDVMLFGSSGLVLFYKTFSTSYGYTKLGTADDPSGLAAALGKGSVIVKFELINNGYF